MAQNADTVDRSKVMIEDPIELLKGLLPYAESRLEDMLAETGDECPSEYTLKAMQFVSSAQNYLSKIEND